MKRELELKFATRVVNNGPVVLVGTKGERGYSGSAVAWCVPASKEPPTVLLHVSPTHLTWENIAMTKDFSINVPGRSLVKEVAFLGGVSGRKANKLRYCGLEALKGKEIESPFFPACMAHLECRVLAMDEELHQVRAEVVFALADEEAFYDHWRIDEGYIPLHHLGGEYYECGNEKIVQPRIRFWQKEE